MRQYQVELPDLDIRVRVIESGAGTPVILLHGNPDNADEWLSVIEQLGDRCRCIAPDLPGYGQSPEPPQSFGYTVKDQISFLDSFLKSVNVTEKMVVVVHDIGGVMGVAWAGTNYSRLKGMVITNAVAYENFNWFQLARMWGDTSTRGRIRAQIGMFAIGLGGGVLFKRIFGKQNPELNAEQLERFARSFALNTAAKNTSLRQFREMLKPEFFKGYDQISSSLSDHIPCRVLWGARDPYVGKENADRFGKATVQILEGCGHWVPLTAADKVASLIEELCNL